MKLAAKRVLPLVIALVARTLLRSSTQQYLCNGGLNLFTEIHVE